ncbi:hypothetical protein EYF80_064155 [Liparis tanakae]|uniref:Uncharacterized protein n=1 Tax=Liparis tanakae TaxID=230148 RepID=A0A4Z2EAZ2_9TELE|nr:hypothetical protein EYF80_064155 [Liparis tanakae]
MSLCFRFCGGETLKTCSSESTSPGCRQERSDWTLPSSPHIHWGCWVMKTVGRRDQPLHRRLRDNT